MTIDESESGGIAEAVMGVIMGHNATGQGATFNLGLILRDLLGVYSYLAAMNPDLSTPQKVRLYCEAEAAEMRRLITSARESQAEDGLADMLRMERVQ